MIPHTLPLEIQNYLRGSSRGEMATLSRTEKVQWILDVLAYVQYATLQREQKGEVAEYLQRVTGYSPAQVKRHVFAYRMQGPAAAPVTPPVFPTAATATLPQPSDADRLQKAPWKLLDRRSVAVAAAVIIALYAVGAGTRYLTGSVTQPEVPVESPVASVPTTAVALTYPARSSSSSPSYSSSSAPSSIYAAISSLPLMSDRIAARREARLAVSAAARGTQYASLFVIGGTPGEGSIVMFRDGKAVWSTLPTVYAGPSVPQPATSGRRPYDESIPRGERSYGGGGGGSDSTTVINNTTTTTSGLSESEADDRYVNEDGDVMAGALRIEFEGIGLQILGTASGNHLHAQSLLTSSGQLIVDGATTLRGDLNVRAAISGSSLTISNLRNCDTIDTDSNGTLTCGIDEGGGVGLTTNNGDPRYVNTSGDTMTGGLLIVNGGHSLPSIEAGVLFEVAGVGSGRVIHVQDQLRSSGSLIVEGTVTLANVPSCTSIQTASNGALSCNNAVYLATSTGSLSQAFRNVFLASSTGALKANFASQFVQSSTGSLKSYFDANYFRTSTGSLKTLFDSLYFRSSTGSLKAFLDTQYFRTSTGSLKTFFDANYFRTSTGSLKTFFDANYLRTSTGSLKTFFDVQYLRTSTGSLKVFFDGQYLRTSTGSLKTFFDALYSRTSTGSLETYFNRRFVNISGDTMTGGLLIVNGGAGTQTIDANVLLEIAGTASGRILRAQDTLASSGTLSVRGGVTFTSLASCTSLASASNGALSCNNAVYLASSTGSLANAFKNIFLASSTGALKANFSTQFVQSSTGSLQTFFDALYFRTSTGSLEARFNGLYFRSSTGSLKTFFDTQYFRTSTGSLKTYFDLQYLRTSTGSLKVLFDSLYFRTSTGALQGYFNPRYVSVAGDTMTGGLLIVNGGAGTQTIDANVLLEIAGTASGRILRAQDTLASSGTLVWEGSASGASLWVSTFEGAGLTDCDADGQALSWDATSKRFVCGDDDNSGGGGGSFTGTGSLKAYFDDEYVNVSGDTMTGGLLIVSGGAGTQTIDANVLLEITGTASGRVLRAQDTLASSGTLVWEGAASGASLWVARLNGAGLTDCDNTTSSKLLWDATSQRFLCASDQDSGGSGAAFTSTGSLQTGFDRRYVQVQGDTMTGGLLLVNGGDGTQTIDADLLLEITGTASGRTLHAQDQLRSSGSLVVEGAVTLATVPSCTSLQTNSNGALSCNNAVYLASSTGSLATAFKNIFLASSTGSLKANFSTQFVQSSTGSLKTFFDSLYFRTSTGSLEARFNTLYTRTSTGSLQAYFNSRYVSVAGDTMTGGLLIVNGGAGTQTIDAGLLLEIAGTASGRTIHAQDNLRSSGSLVIEGNVTLANIPSCTSIQTASNGALSCNNAVYLATSTGSLSQAFANVFLASSTGAVKANFSTQFVQSSTGSLKTLFDALYFRSSTGSLQTYFNGLYYRTSTGALQAYFNPRYVSVAGDTMTGGLLIVNGGAGTQTIDTGLLLEIAGTASGRILHAQDQLRSSGSLVIEGAVTLANIPSCTSIQSASNGALSCNNAVYLATSTGSLKTFFDANYFRTSTGSLKANFATQFVQSSTGSLQTFFDALYFRTSTGALRASFDNRFVRRSGSTMTGGLLIVNGGAGTQTIDTGLLLEIAGTASGRILRAQDTLASSGSLVFEGSASGALLWVSRFDGAGLADCDDGTNSKLLWDTTSKRFSCGTDQTGGGSSGAFTSTGSLQTYFNRNYVQVRGDTMTGGLLIVNGGAGTQTIDVGLLLEIAGTASGRVLHARDKLTSSGMLVIRNTRNRFGTGALVYSSGGVVMALDSYYKGTNAGVKPHLLFGYQGNFDTNLYRFNANILKTDDSLWVLKTLSGGDIFAGTSLRSSGTLVFEGNASGALLWVSRFEGAGLTDCDTAATSKLMWDATSKRFSCGTDQSGGGAFTSTGSLKTYFDRNYVQIAGDTMTGGLLIMSGGAGTATIDAGLLLEIAGTASGRTLHGQDKLTSSGMLVIRNSRSRYGTGALVYSSGGVVMALDSYYKGTNASRKPHLLFGYRGTFDTNLYRFNANILKTDDSLWVVGTLSGSSVHAERLLTSSGELIIERAEDSRFIQLQDKTNNDSVGIYAGSGTPNGVVTAQLGSTYYDSNGGKMYLKAAGDGTNTGWQEIQTGSGSLQMARMNKTGGAQTLYGGSVRQKIYLDAVSFDVGGIANVTPGSTGSGRITIKKAGKYLVTASWQIGATCAASDRVDTAIYINNNLVELSEAQCQSQVIESPITQVFDLAVNNYIEMFVGIGTANSTTTAGHGAPYLSVVQLNVTPGADIAEFYGTYDDSINPGDLVVMDPARHSMVKKSTAPYEKGLLGVVSTHPGMVLGGDYAAPDGAKTVILGLAGRVPVKVTTENGPIEAGDLLTSASKPGFAMKATGPGPVVGQALEGFDGSEADAGLVMTFINNSRIGSVGDAVINVGSGATLQNSDVSRSGSGMTMLVDKSLQQLIASGALVQPIQSEVEKQIEFLSIDDRIEARVNALLDQRLGSGTTVQNQESGISNQDHNSQFIIPDSLTITGSLLASSLALEETLSVGGDTRVGGDLYLEGTLNVASLFIPGMTRIDGSLSVGSELEAATLRVSSGAVIDGALTLNGSLNLASGSTLALGSGASLDISNLVVRSALKVLGGITIDGLALFLDDVEIQGELTVSERIAGVITLPKSGTAVTVYFDPPYKDLPVVNVTPNGRVGAEWWVSPVSMTGFTINVGIPVTDAVRFTWFAVGVRKDAEKAEEAKEAEGVEADSSSVAFPVDSSGTPVSSNAVWNACIRNQVTLDESGQPLSCARYHEGNVWEHPDLLISFTWNTAVTPPLLILPEGYEATVALGSEVEEAEDAQEAGEVDASVETQQVEEAPAEAAPTEEDPVEIVEPEPVAEETVPEEEAPVEFGPAFEEDTVVPVPEEPAVLAEEEPVVTPVEPASTEPVVVEGE